MPKSSTIYAVPAQNESSLLYKVVSFLLSQVDGSTDQEKACALLDMVKDVRPKRDKGKKSKRNLSTAAIDQNHQQFDATEFGKMFSCACAVIECDFSAELFHVVIKELEAIKEKELQSQNRSHPVSLLEKHFPSYGISWAEISTHVFGGALPHQVHPDEAPHFHQMFPFMVVSALSAGLDIPSLTTRKGLEEIARGMHLYVDMPGLTDDVRAIFEEKFRRVTIRGDKQDHEDAGCIDSPDIILCLAKNQKDHLPKEWSKVPFLDRYKSPLVVVVSSERKDIRVSLPTEWAELEKLISIIKEKEDQPFEYKGGTYRAGEEGKLYILGPEAGDVQSFIKNFDRIILGTVFRPAMIIPLQKQQGAPKVRSTVQSGKLAESFGKNQGLDGQGLFEALGKIFLEACQEDRYTKPMSPGKQDAYQIALTVIAGMVTEQPNHPLWGTKIDEIREGKRSGEGYPRQENQQPFRGPKV